MLQKCISLAVEAYPPLFAVLSAGGTVSFVSTNEMGDNSRSLTVCRSKGGSREPLCFELVLLRDAVSRSALGGYVVCCSIVKCNAAHLHCFV